MSESKYTPGPWKVDLISNFDNCERTNFCVTAEIKPNDQPLCVVAEIYGNNWSPEQERSDAELITAAPDMLKALELFRSALSYAYSQIGGIPGDEFWSHFERADNYAKVAISKAGGK